MGAVMEDTQQKATFEHYNVTGIDPGKEPLPAGVGYTFELTAAEVKTYGDQGNERVSLGFSVVDDPQGGALRGRIAWVSLFPDRPGETKTADKLNTLAKQSGIKQSTPGVDGFKMWLEALRAARPRFTGEIREFTKRNGQLESEVNMFGLRAA